MDFSNYLTPINIIIAVLGLISVVLLAYRFMYPPSPIKDTFTSTNPGTLQQLSSSNVPTEEDDEQHSEEGKRTMAESDDMTREQPSL